MRTLRYATSARSSSERSFYAAQSSWKWFAAVTFIRVFGGSAYYEINGIGAATAAIPIEELAWTMPRLSILTNGKEDMPVVGSLIGSGDDWLTISRASLAAWCLAEVSAKKWVGKCPLLSNH